MKLDSEIYRKAAKLIQNGKNDWCCKAIRDVCGTEVLDCQVYVEAFAEYFKPPAAHFYSVWFGSHYNREHRITALLFMADIIEQGE